MIEQNFPSLTNRRDFLKRTGMMAATAHFMADAATAATSSITSIVDCHIHLWAADKEKFPFHPNAPYIPSQVSTIEPVSLCIDFKLRFHIWNLLNTN